MGNVVDLQSEREARDPHVDGLAHCGACGYQWHTVVPAGVTVGLECAECGSMRGMLTHPVDNIGDRNRWECKCGNQLFFVTEDSIICHQCGLEHSEE